MFLFENCANILAGKFIKSYLERNFMEHMPFVEPWRKTIGGSSNYVLDSEGNYVEYGVVLRTWCKFITEFRDAVLISEMPVTAVTLLYVCDPVYRLVHRPCTYADRHLLLGKKIVYVDAEREIKKVDTEGVYVGDVFIDYDKLLRYWTFAGGHMIGHVEKQYWYQNTHEFM